MTTPVAGRKNGKMRKILLSQIIIVALIICLAVGATVFTASALSDSDLTLDNPTLEIVSNNVSYSESIYILYAISNEGFDRAKYEIKMLFWNEAQETYTLGTEKYSKTNEGKAKVKGKDCLIFYSDGIAAKEMTDDVYARACVVIGDKEYYSDVMKFSVLEYVHTMKEQGNVGNGEIKLFTTMLEYGTAAQHNFNHNTSRPANGNYHKISVIGGKCPDGFDKGRYLEGDKVIIKPDDAPDGKRFSRWIDEKGIIVSYDKEFEVNVGTSEKTYEAVYKDISSITAQLKLNTEIPYNATADKLDLPTAVSFEIGGETVILELIWDTSSFAAETIGKQTLYADLKDTDAYNKYGIEPGSITMEVTTLPYTYELDQTSGEYILTGYYGSDSVITVPTSYRNVFITRIATKAFNNVDGLKNVIIPNTVKVIENGAFWYCDDIEEISVPFIGESVTSSNSWFGWIFGASSCNVQYGFIPLAFKSVTVLNGAVKIPDYAFYKCSQIEEIKMPSSVTEIGMYSFSDCLGLKEFTITENLRWISFSPFRNCLNLKRVNVENVDSLFDIYCVDEALFVNGADMYYDGKIVSEISIPRGVESVSAILKGCTSIKKIYVPNSVCNFGQSAFSLPCLETVIFESGNKTTEIGNVFEKCKSLKSIDLSSLTELQKITDTFYNCTLLDEIILPNSINDIGVRTFSKTAIEEFVLPENIEYIGDDCFLSCEKLKEIVIPIGVVSIGKNAFYDCVLLEKVILPETIVSIGSQAFSGCASLESIVIPSRVYNIDSWAFHDCSKLTQIIFSSERLEIIDEGAFYDCSTLTDIYYVGSVEQWNKITINSRNEILKNASIHYNYVAE